MNKAFYKGVAIGAITASIAVGCINKQPDVTVQQLQLENEVEVLTKVQEASTRMLGQAFLQNEVLFLDVLMEGDDFWTVADFYKNTGRDFFDEAEISSEVGYNLADFQ